MQKVIQRAERQILKHNKDIDLLCFRSKNLYNLANYYIRQEFFKNRKWIRNFDLDKQLRKTEDYKILPAQSCQQILILLDKNWKSFFKAVKQYKKTPNEFTGRPKLPGYKHKTKGRGVVVFTSQQVRIRSGFLHFPRKSGIDPTRTRVENKDLCQVRIVPQATCYILEVVYKKEINNEIETIPQTYLGIDLGVNNLATCSNNIGKIPFVINGRPLKSMNQYYNKLKAKYQSFVPDKGKSKRLDRLTFKRNCKVQDFLHKASRLIVERCRDLEISQIIIGKNPLWKKEMNLGKRNNQNFVSIPFDTLVKQIEHKAEEYGISVNTQQESHTSKCSFLDGEEICHHDKYLGRRVKRGLFRSSKGKLVNADVNGSLNIIKKAVPDAFSKGTEGVGLHPVIVNIS